MAVTRGAAPAPFFVALDEPLRFADLVEAFAEGVGDHLLPGVAHLAAEVHAGDPRGGLDLDLGWSRGLHGLHRARLPTAPPTRNDRGIRLGGAETSRAPLSERALVDVDLSAHS